MKGDIKLPIKTFAKIFLTEVLKRKKGILVLKGLANEIDLTKFGKIYRTRPNSWDADVFFKFYRGSDDFIMQKVSLLRLLPVCVGLIMLITSGV